MKYLLRNKLYQKWDKIKSLFVATNLKLLKSQAIPVTLSNSFIEIFLTFLERYITCNNITFYIVCTGADPEIMKRTGKGVLVWLNVVYFIIIPLTFNLQPEYFIPNKKLNVHDL